MEAAPRPSPELLVDLPLEEPLDALAPPKREPPTLAPAPPVPAPASTARPAKDPEQTDLHFMDPELFLPPDDPSGALPFAPQAAAPVEHPDAALELQDPIVAELLSSPPPPPAPGHPSRPLVGRPPGQRHGAGPAGIAAGRRWRREPRRWERQPRAGRPGCGRRRWHRQPRHRPRHLRYT